MIQKEPYTSVLLSTAYLPPIAYFKAFLNFEHAFLEVKEHYVKQSYRNRCLIASIEGVKDLIIPVSKTTFNHCLIQDVRIDYSQSGSELIGKPWKQPIIPVHFSCIIAIISSLFIPNKFLFYWILTFICGSAYTIYCR